MRAVAALLFDVSKMEDPATYAGLTIAQRSELKKANMRASNVKKPFDTLVGLLEKVFLAMACLKLPKDFDVLPVPVTYPHVDALSFRRCSEWMGEPYLEAWQLQSAPSAPIEFRSPGAMHLLLCNAGLRLCFEPVYGVLQL